MDELVQFITLFIAISIGYFLAFFQLRNSTLGRSSQQHLKEKLSLLFRLEDDGELSKLVSSLEVSKDTFNIHMAIGSHYRKRGEVEGAIALHQSLLGHPEFSQSVYGEVVLELAKDYMAAGLLDRAEAILLKIMEQKEYKTLAVLKLIDIYQQEKDWVRAISLSALLDAKMAFSLRVRLAHFSCELAQLSFDRGESWEAQGEIKRALEIDKDCIRALLLLSDIHIHQENYEEAVSTLKRSVVIDDGYVWEVGSRIVRCVDRGYSLDTAIKFLRSVYAERQLLGLALCLGELLGRDGRFAEALALLEKQLNRFPGIFGLVKLLEFYKRESGRCGDFGASYAQLVSVMSSVCDQLSGEMATYKCICCGFEAKTLYWMCPSCREWSTSKPALDYVDKSKLLHVPAIRAH